MGRSISGARDRPAVCCRRSQIQPANPAAPRASRPASAHGHCDVGSPPVVATDVGLEGAVVPAGSGDTSVAVGASIAAGALGAGEGRAGPGGGIDAALVVVSAGVSVTTGGTMTGGGVTRGAGACSALRSAGAGAGGERRDSGTSGATGPCRSGGGCCVELLGGRRKSLTAACAGTAGAASIAASRIRGVERISVAAGMPCSA
jgi:hypothetical protein